MDKNSIKETKAEGTLNSNDCTITSYILFSTFVAALASFNAGYNIGVINIPETVIRDCPLNATEMQFTNGLPHCLSATNFYWGLGVGIFALGGGVGGLSSGKLSEAFGRKKALMFLNVFFILGGFLLATSTELIQFGVGRFMVGIGSGLSSALVSTYVGEIATIKYRGALGTVLQFMLVVGILVSSIFGLFLSYAPGWRILLGLTTVPAVAQIILMFFCKETPRYLVSHDKFDKARRSLQALRHGFDIEEELETIIAGHKEAQQLGENNRNLNVFEVLREKKYLKLVLIVAIVHISSQFTGINSVIFYSTSMLEKIFSKDNSRYITVSINILNLIITLISVYLVDKLGRKVLILSSHVGMAISSSLLAIGAIFGYDYLVVAAVLMFVASFAVGLGPVPWMLMSEIFPTKILGGATSIAIACNWTSTFAIGWAFPPLNELLNKYTFLVFAAISVASFFFTSIFLPETKGRSIEEITRKNRND